MDKKYKNEWRLRKTTLSEDRIKWLKDVAWNLSRITHKYDRLAIYEELTYQELHLLSEYEHEEDMKIIRELEGGNKRLEAFLREIEKEKASASMNYLFPIGEA